MTSRHTKKLSEKEKIDLEKRRILFDLAEFNNGGLSMYTDINELRYARTMMKRQVMRQSAIAEIQELENQGLTRAKGLDLEKASLPELEEESRRLHSQYFEQRALSNGFQLMKFLMEKHISVERLTERKILCLDCNAENFISIAHCPVKDYKGECKKCKLKTAAVYMPQCGHICYCVECAIDSRQPAPQKNEK